MKTFNELERAAYMLGDTELSSAAHAAQTLWDIDDAIGGEYVLDATLYVQIDAKIAAEVGTRYPDYAAYKKFFEDCFDHLGDHYPCPSVTSDYDQSVIFDAIGRARA